MKLSTQGQHAIMAMLALAIHDHEGALRLSDLAKRQDISLSYLEQIFAKLRQEGLVEGIRGPGGGYRLSRSAEDINLAEIALAAESEAIGTLPVATAANNIPEQKLVNHMWENLSKSFYDFLADMTLASLMQGHKLPRRNYRMGKTASMIASMFPAARSPLGQAAMM